MKKDYDPRAESANALAQALASGERLPPSLADRVEALEAEVLRLRLEVARLNQNPNA